MRYGLVLLTALAALSASPSPAQTTDQLFERCKDFRGNPDLSIGACTALIQSGTVSDATLSTAFLHRGSSRAVLGDYDRALADFDAAEKLDRTNAVVYFNRGIVYILTGRLAEASREADKALAARPGFVLAYAVDGERTRRQGLFSAAKNYFAKGLSAPIEDPRQEQALREWQAKAEQGVQCEAFSRNLDLGISGCTAVISDTTIEAHPKVTALTHRGYAYYLKENFAAALADYDEAIRRYDESYPVRNSRAQILIELGRYDDALRDLERSRVLNRTDSTAVSLQGMVAYRRGNHALAIQKFTEADNLASAESYEPLRKVKRARHAAERAIVYLATGRTAEAQRDVDLAISLRPEEEFALYVRGVIRGRSGDVAGATADIAAAKAGYAYIETFMKRMGVTR